MTLSQKDEYRKGLLNNNYIKAHIASSLNNALFSIPWSKSTMKVLWSTQGNMFQSYYTFFL